MMLHAEPQGTLNPPKMSQAGCRNAGELKSYLEKTALACLDEYVPLKVGLARLERLNGTLLSVPSLMPCRVDDDTLERWKHVQQEHPEELAGRWEDFSASERLELKKVLSANQVQGLQSVCPHISRFRKAVLIGADEELKKESKDDFFFAFPFIAALKNSILDTLYSELKDSPTYARESVALSSEALLAPWHVSIWAMEEWLRTGHRRPDQLAAAWEVIERSAGKIAEKVQNHTLLIGEIVLSCLTHFEIEELHPLRLTESPPAAMEMSEMFIRFLEQQSLDALREFMESILPDWNSQRRLTELGRFGCPAAKVVVQPGVSFIDAASGICKEFLESRYLPFIEAVFCKK